MDHLQFRRAIEMNDEAHRKTIREMANGGDTMDRQDVFKEIQSEARMWLRHLYSIHQPHNGSK